MRPPKQQIIPSQEEVDSSTKKDNMEELIITEEEGDDKKDGDSSSGSSAKNSSTSGGFIPKLKSPINKTGFKAAGILVGGMIAIYKMFLSSADDSAITQDAVDQGVVVQQQKPMTSKDFAKQDIPMSNRPGGAIVSKEEDKKINTVRNEIESSKTVALPKLVEPKLDAPEIPPLPDLIGDTQQQSAPTIKPPSFNKVARQSNIQQNNNNNQQQPVDPNDPNAVQNPNAQQPFNPQNVTANGIPIINSADLTVEQKRQLTMFVIPGNGPAMNSGNAQKKQKSDIIIVDGTDLSVKKQADNVTAQRAGNLETTLLQGKVLEAVLETAINSQLPGNVRGVVTTDVYGETGNKVLIPRGSRIYGSYSTQVTRGQSRVMILWNRVIRPDGISISINAQAADTFGRAGVEGDVDNRFADSFTNSLLITFATLGAAVALDKVAGSSATQSQTINPSGTFTTSNISPTSVAAQTAIQTVQKFAQQMTQGSDQLPPIVSLPQGTKLLVIVNQDITLPPFKKIHID